MHTTVSKLFALDRILDVCKQMITNLKKKHNETMKIVMVVIKYLEIGQISALKELVCY